MKLKILDNIKFAQSNLSIIQKIIKTIDMVDLKRLMGAAIALLSSASNAQFNTSMI